MKTIKEGLTESERQSLWEYYISVSSTYVTTGKLVIDRTQPIVLKLRQLVGLDRCQIVNAGGVAFPPQLQHFIRVMTGCITTQVYGQTEGGTGLSVQDFMDPHLGHVGKPLAGTLFKLVSREDLGYTVDDKPYPRGEVYVKGPGRALGFYKNPSLTDKIFNNIPGGWVATGDIGRLNPNGTLSLIDRAGQFYKSRQGQFVSAEEVQQFFLKNPYYKQIWVYCPRSHVQPIAIIVPDRQRIIEYMTSQGWWDEKNRSVKDYPIVAKQHYEELRLLFTAIIADQEKDKTSADKLLDFYLELDVDEAGNGFTVEKGLLTATLGKFAPVQARRYYDKQILELLSKHGISLQA